MLTLDPDTAAHLGAEEPDWAAQRRRNGLDTFAALAMPSSREEVWRYVDLDFDLADLGVPAEPGDPLPGDEAVLAALDTVATATVVDGRTVAADTSDSTSTFMPIRRAMTEVGDDLRQAFGKGIDPTLDKFAAAHHAFGGDGIFLHVPKGAAPSGVFYVDIQAATPGTVTFPRLTIVVGDGAAAKVVVHYNSPRNERFVVVPHIEADVGDNAQLDLTALQEFAYDTVAVSQLRMAAGADARIRLGEVGLGGSLARLHLTMELQGRGSRGEVSGMYFGEQKQVLDYRAFMNHRAPNTSSDMFLKGAVEDEADSVFTGLIRIEPEAQHTNAFQTNRNLVLSDGAEAQSVPNLEILANDVRCGHGSTVGPLDEEQRYYLMSRGLDRTRADRLQVRGFFEEAIARLPEPSLADAVRRRVNGKFVAAQREGRV